jgi:hypothetical protein
MSKNKNESNGVAVLDGPQLMLAIDLDDIDGIPTSDEPVADVPSPGAPVADSEDQVIATVETVEQVFANDPLAKDWLAWGMRIKAKLDNTDLAAFYVSCGRELSDLAVKERNIAPGSYERAKIIKKGETTLRVLNVTESMVRPNELIGMYQVLLLDRSTPGAEGEGRSYDRSEIPADYFSGNLVVGVLRTLASCIGNVEKKGELDVYEYKSGFEPVMRDWTKKLRAGDLTNNQVKALIDSRKKHLAAVKAHAEMQGLNTVEREAMENAKRVASREARIAEIKSDVLTLTKNAAEKLKYGKDDLKDLLQNMQVIAPDKTILEYAKTMTKGDAKALIQQLATLAATDRDRAEVFAVLYKVAHQIVAQMKSAQQSKLAKAAG